jgi:hypothetical protein
MIEALLLYDIQDHFKSGFRGWRFFSEGFAGQRREERADL